MPSNAPSTISGLGADTASSMFQAIGGLRNTRALIAWLSCTVAGLLLLGLLAKGLGTGGLVLGFLIFMVAFGTGANAAGLLQMDQARGVPLRGLTDALIYGLMCIPKLIALGLVFLVATLVFFLVLALVFFVCKIPGLGPVLYAVALPLAVVATGLLVTAVSVCMLLSLPAIWEGSTIARALTQTFAIARSRLIETLLLFVVVGVLCFIVAMIVFGVLLNGLLPVLALSSSVLASEGYGMGGGLAALIYGLSSGGGYAASGGLGIGVLWAIAGALVGQVYLQGLNLVYLRVTEGLDVSGAEALLQRKLDEANHRSAELAAKVRAAAAQVAPAPSPADARAAAAASAAAAYGGYSTPPPAYSPPPVVPPSGFAPTMPPSSMASPPAYAAPPVARPSFEFPPPAGQPGTSNPPVSGAAPLDLEFGFDLPGAPTPATSAWSGIDPATTLPLRPSPALGTGTGTGTGMESSRGSLIPPPFPPIAAPAEPPAAMTMTCSKCLSPASPDDVFCSVCGNRLQ